MRPFVVINVASTADGKIDTVERQGAPISSDSDRARVDALRASVDAVMVGGRTLLDEDPRLTVRSPELRAQRVARGLPENPAKVGVTSSLALRPDARFLTHGPARILLFAPAGTHDPGLQARGVEVYRCGAPKVDLTAAMQTLDRLGVERVLVEGGATLNFELLRLGLVAEVQVYIAPLIFGGATAPTLAGGGGLMRAAAISLQRQSVDVLDDGGVLVRYSVMRSGS
ncbi:MAG: dihydrofolate reductase family protein [Chloroflexi bacterium]|nr:dihydrofolate reductase family protein [Chloroflexota bacterium]